MQVTFQRFYGYQAHLDAISNSNFMAKANKDRKLLIFNNTSFLGAVVYAGQCNWVSLKAKVRASLGKQLKKRNAFLVSYLPKVITAFFESGLEGLLSHFRAEPIKPTVPCNKLINRNRLTARHGALVPSSVSLDLIQFIVVSLLGSGGKLYLNGDWIKCLVRYFRLPEVWCAGERHRRLFLPGALLSL